MAAIPRTGTSWTIVVRNVVIHNVARFGDDAIPPALTYAITHNGTAYLSGALVWADTVTGIGNAWSKEFLLPTTPGVLKATVTATLGSAIGEDSQSLKVVQ